MLEGLRVGVGTGVGVGVAVAVGDGDGVAVGTGVAVSVGVGDGVAVSLEHPARNTAMSIRAGASQPAIVLNVAASFAIVSNLYA